MGYLENRELLKSYSENTEFDTGEERGLKQPALFEVRGGEVISLPKDFDSCIKQPDFTRMLTERRSRRKYLPESLSLTEFAFLLWSAQGVKRISKTGTSAVRTVPSAGARHSLELYAAVLRVDGLRKGVYHYLAAEHKLEYLGEPDDMETMLCSALCGQTFAVSGACVLMLTAVPERMEFRYGNFAAKYILLDAGHVFQNVYLACEAIGCGTCAIAAYMQEQADEFLGLNHIQGETGKLGESGESVIYAASVGRTDLRS